MQKLQPTSKAVGPTILPAAAPPRRGLLTAAIWIVSIAALAAGGLLASLFVMMPVSLDIGEMVAAGADPWRDAAYAAIAYCGLFGASAVALALWHRARRRTAAGIMAWAAWAITAAEVVFVAWGGAAVMRDWF